MCRCHLDNVTSLLHRVEKKLSSAAPGAAQAVPGRGAAGGAEPEPRGPGGAGSPPKVSSDEDDPPADLSDSRRRRRLGLTRPDRLTDAAAAAGRHAATPRAQEEAAAGHVCWPRPLRREPEGSGGGKNAFFRHYDDQPHRSVASRKILPRLPKAGSCVM